ncbi:MAG: response regulator [Betaproteobacteria bacterium]|nr:MAG: response regulator [Betaproteobacteria bacterium]
MDARSNADVFIVEDSPAVRDSLVDLVNSIDGARVVGVADNPNAAIETILARRPKCVVLDFQLIGGTAIDVLRAVREPLHDMVVIVLTNYPEPGYRRACMNAGADWFLDKSTQFEEVQTIVSGLASPRTTSVGCA